MLEVNQSTATEIRKDILIMLTEASSGHTAASLGLVEIFMTLYGSVLRHNPNNPQWEDRDRLCLSAGHVVPVRYATMAHAGYLPKEELKTLRKTGTRLQGHPNMHDLEGLEHSSGPLGQGISIATGMALAAKKDGEKHHIYCITGDGELQEGQVWEAAMFAPAKQLGNLTLICDRNNIQIDGHTEEVMPLEPLTKKWNAFGWDVLEIDGHNTKEIEKACKWSKKKPDIPTIIIANTIPGKGIEKMENKAEWHGKVPKKENLENILGQL